MRCSRCVDEAKHESELRVFWRQVPDGDKRVMVAGLVTVAGAAAGWTMSGSLGVVVGGFIAGCLGGIFGLARYSGDGETLTATEPGQRRELPFSRRESKRLV